MKGFEGTFKSRHQHHNNPDSFENGRGAPGISQDIHPHEDGVPPYDTALPATDFTGFEIGTLGKRFAGWWKSTPALTVNYEGIDDNLNVFPENLLQHPAGLPTVKADEGTFGNILKRHDF